MADVMTENVSDIEQRTENNRIIDVNEGVCLLLFATFPDSN